MQRIPKIIHCCWLSGDPYPDLIQKCQKSWVEKLSGYKIKLWTTENFDVNVCDYTREAFAEKKYAFVSDYIRLYALYTEGGIYLDMDIEVLQNFDALLGNRAFSCFQNEYSVAAWIFGSEKGNPIFKEFLDYYSNRHFIKANGKYDMTPNPIPITQTCKQHGLLLNNQTQKLDHITIYSKDYFCPYDHVKEELNITEHSYCIHYFDAGWNSIEQKKMMSKRKKIEARYGYIASLIYQGIIDIRFNGLASCLRKVIKKFKL